MARARVLTPKGEAAIAVVGVEGDDAGDVLGSLGAAPLPRPGRIVLRELRLFDGGESERAVVVASRQGFEVHLHGNPLLAARLLERCGGPCEAAPPTLEEEILEAARNAPSQLGMCHCLAQRSGSGLLGLARELLSSAGSEPATRDRLRAALARGAALRPLLDPPRVVLRGPVNAGKSTLLNLLLGRPRVRSGPAPALTRDPVAELCVVEGWPLCVIDTAGTAAPGSDIDRQAMALAAQLEESADLVVWVVAATAPADPQAERANLVRLWTHADRTTMRPVGVAGEPAVNLVGPEREATRRRLGAWLVHSLGLAEPAPGAAWLTVRQRDLLERALAGVTDGRREVARRAAVRLLGAGG